MHGIQVTDPESQKCLMELSVNEDVGILKVGDEIRYAGQDLKVPIELLMVRLDGLLKAAKIVKEENA